jgi:hypothetical protein
MNGVEFNQRTCSLRCLHCFEEIEIRRAVAQDPHQFVEFLELVQMDHSECANYSDVRMARSAREFRKEAKRLEILSRRVARVQ